MDDSKKIKRRNDASTDCHSQIPDAHWIFSCKPGDKLDYFDRKQGFMKEFSRWKPVLIKKIQRLAANKLKLHIFGNQFFQILNIETLKSLNQKIAKAHTKTVCHTSICKKRNDCFFIDSIQCEFCKINLCSQCLPLTSHNKQCTIHYEEKSIMNAIKDSQIFDEEEYEIIQITSQYAIGYIMYCDSNKCNKEIAINNQYDLLCMNWPFAKRSPLKGAFYYNIDERFVKHEDKEKMIQIYGEYGRFFCSKSCAKYRCIKCNNPISEQQVYCRNHAWCHICNRLFNLAENVRNCKNCKHFFCNKSCGESGDNDLCKNCMLSIEIEEIKLPLLAAMNQQLDVYIIDIIVEYAVGINTNCIKCDCIIGIRNRFDYFKQICDKKVGFKIYKYRVDPKSLKSDEYKYLYGEYVRIWCNKCKSVGSTFRCKYDGYQCNNYDKVRGSRICANHKLCSECGTLEFNKRSKEKRKIIECISCGKYVCIECSFKAKCDSCVDIQIIERKNELLTCLLPLFDWKIINILTNYSLGYVVNCNNWECDKEFVINYKEQFMHKADANDEYFNVVEAKGCYFVYRAHFVFKKWVKIFCTACADKLYDTDINGIKRWNNCYWCAEYCWLYDCCDRCKEYHCKECQCNEECDDCGYKECQCQEYYYDEFIKYDPKTKTTVDTRDFILN